MELITHAERELIEARLNTLIANRPVMSQRIAEARALGDLKENGDYHAAREEQGLQEAEIRRLQNRLASAQVIADTRYDDAGIVFVGATVKIREVGSDLDELFRLVGEASGTAGGDVTEVTVESPMGEALLKARVGETVTVRTPRGSMRLEIVAIV
ncbi:MAG: transcription elongation factor GreA [Phycisphaerae bacterium]|nr:transcription elongation factor GreA [Phycisphaerae bacterium]